MNELIELPMNQVVVEEEKNVRVENEDLSELMESIKQHGVIQPIGVYRKQPDGLYYLCWGHRRFKASAKLGNTLIPAIVLEKPLSEDKFFVLNAIENVQRKDISPIELGTICLKLEREHGYTRKEVAVALGVGDDRVRKVIGLALYAPDKWKLKVKDRTANVKPVGLNTSVANAIAIRHMPENAKNLLYSVGEKENLTVSEVDLIFFMSNRGLTIENALEERKKFFLTHPKIVLNREKWEKIQSLGKISITDLVNKLLWDYEAGLVLPLGLKGRKLGRKNRKRVLA